MTYILHSYCRNRSHILKSIYIHVNNRYVELCEICDINRLHDPRNKLDSFKPIQIDKGRESELILCLNELLVTISLVSGTNSKVKNCMLMFSWIAKNIWFIERHKRFRDVLKRKLEEFRHDHLAKDIIHRYGWIEFIGEPPYGPLSTYGRRINKLCK